MVSILIACFNRLITIYFFKSKLKLQGTQNRFVKTTVNLQLSDNLLDELWVHPRVHCSGYRRKLGKHFAFDPCYMHGNISGFFHRHYKIIWN